MAFTDSAEYIIAAKHSARPIKSSEDVERFFELLATEYPDDLAELILGELTELLYNRKLDNKREYVKSNMKYPQSADNQYDFFEHVH